MPADLGPPPAPILYEFDRILVVDKPAKILTIPGPKETRNLTSLLDDWIASRDGPGSMRVHPCHRLDKDTSGILVFARGKAAQKEVMAWFAERRPIKIYLCLVSGQPGRSAGTIDRPIEGQSAITQYQVLAQGPDSALVKCKLHTGRTNQIRIHLAEMGHPLVGDYRFGRRSASLAADRTLLHAWHLALPAAPMPVSAWTAPLPADFRAAAAAQGFGSVLDGLTM